MSAFEDPAKTAEWEFAKGGVVFGSHIDSDLVPARLSPGFVVPAPTRPDPGVPERRGGRPEWLRFDCSPRCSRPIRARRWQDRIWTCTVCQTRWTYDKGWRRLLTDYEIAELERELGIDCERIDP